MPNDLFGELQRLITQKQRINQTTLGIPRARAGDHSSSHKTKSFKNLPDFLKRVTILESQTESTRALTQRVSASAEWRNHSLWIHTLHVSCHCSASYESPQGLLLKQQHRDNSMCRYVPVSSLEGLSGYSINELHRQERVPVCHQCQSDRIASRQFIATNGQLTFNL